jgi:protease-4
MLFKKKKEINIDEVLETELKVYKTKLLIARLSLLLWLVIIGIIGFAVFSLFRGVSPGMAPFPLHPYIAVVNINRVITTDYANRLMEKLDRLKKSKECRGVLVIFNTPGGSPAGSDELAAYFKDFAKHKPLFGYVESMAASGGYYIASAFKPLLANKNAIVGSIGVIMPHYSLQKLAQKVGVEWDGIAVGKYKDVGNLLKKLTPDQKGYLEENLLQPTYQNFLKVVAKNRGIKLDKLKKYADGKIFLASKVKGVLVDRIITLTEVKNRLRQEFGKNIRFYKVVVYPPKGLPVQIKLKSDLGEFLKSQQLGQ